MAKKDTGTLNLSSLVCASFVSSQPQALPGLSGDEGQTMGHSKVISPRFAAGSQI